MRLLIETELGENYFKVGLNSEWQKKTINISRRVLKPQNTSIKFGTPREIDVLHAHLKKYIHIPNKLLR